MSEWQWNAVEIWMLFFESFLLYNWFFSGKFEFRYRKIKSLLLMMVFPTVTYVLDKVCEIPSMKTLILLFVGIIMIYIIYQCTISQSVLWNGIFMFLLIVGDSISMGFLLSVHGEDDIAVFLESSFIRIQSFMLAKLLDVILMVLCTKLLWVERKKYNLREVGVLLLQAFSSVLCLVMVVEFTYYYEEEQMSWSMLFLVFLAIVVLVSYLLSFYLTNRYFEYRDREEEILLIEMKNKKIISEYNSLDNSQQKVYQLYHDLKKHLNVVNMMNQKKEVDEYLRKCFEDIHDIDGKFQTGNHYVDMVLYDEWKKATDLGIHVQFAVETGSLDLVELHDIIIILCNALENAREACKKKLDIGEKAYMQLKVLKMERQVVLVISNNYVGEVKHKNNIFLTSKQEKGLHGIGMKSIRNSVEKYQGSMEISIKDKKFILTIMLSVSE